MKISCVGTVIKCTRKDVVTTGMSGMEVTFDFDSAWDGVTGKVAVFACGTVEKQVAIDGNKAICPWETFENGVGQMFRIGVYGFNESGATYPSPTPYCDIGTVQRGVSSVWTHEDPSPTMMEQLIIIASSASEKAEAAKLAADAASEAAGEAVERCDEAIEYFDSTKEYVDQKVALIQNIENTTASHMTKAENAAKDANTAYNAVSKIENKVEEMEAGASSSADDALRYSQDASGYADAASKSAQDAEEEKNAAIRIRAYVQELYEEVHDDVHIAEEYVKRVAGYSEDLYNARNISLEQISKLGNDVLFAVGDAGVTQVNAVNSSGVAQVSAVEGKGSEQVRAITTAGASQIENINSAGNEKIAEIEALDYEDLAEKVTAQSAVIAQQKIVNDRQTKQIDTLFKILEGQELDFDTQTQTAYELPIESAKGKVMGASALDMLGGMSQVIEGEIRTAQTSEIVSYSSNLFNATADVYEPFDGYDGKYVTASSEIRLVFGFYDADKTELWANWTNTTNNHGRYYLSALVPTGTKFVKFSRATANKLMVQLGQNVDTKYVTKGILDKLTIPQDCPVLHGINDSVYDYLEFADDKVLLHKRVGVVDLGSLNWVVNNTSNGTFISYGLQAICKPSTLNVLSNNFITCSYDDRSKNHSISVSPDSLFVHDEDYIGYSGERFKNAMSEKNVILAYELSTKQILDITEVFKSFDNLIEVEDGGTLTFKNSAENEAEGIHIPVPSTVTYPVRLGV